MEHQCKPSEKISRESPYTKNLIGPDRNDKKRIEPYRLFIKFYKVL